MQNTNIWEHVEVISSQTWLTIISAFWFWEQSYLRTSQAISWPKLAGALDCSQARPFINVAVQPVGEALRWRVLSFLCNFIHKTTVAPSQAFTPYHPNAFTPSSFLKEGRAGIAWEPSNSKMLSSLRHEMFLVSSPRFHLAFTLLVDFVTRFLYFFHSEW
jgi:hypothetical protein